MVSQLEEHAYSQRRNDTDFSEIILSSFVFMMMAITKTTMMIKRWRKSEVVLIAESTLQMIRLSW